MSCVLVNYADGAVQSAAYQPQSRHRPGEREGDVDPLILNLANPFPPEMSLNSVGLLP